MHGSTITQLIRIKFLLSAVLSWLLNPAFCQSIKTDSLLQILKYSNSITSRVLAFEELPESLSSKAIDSIYNLLKVEVEHREFLLEKYKLNMAYERWISREDPAFSIRLLKEATRIAESLDSIDLVVKSKYELFFVYLFKTNEDAKGLQELLDIHEFFKNGMTKNKVLESMVLSGFGEYYGLAQKNFRKSAMYFKQCLTIYKELEQDRNIGVMYINLGECAEEYSLDSAVIYYDSALMVERKLKSVYYQSYIQGAIAKCFLKRKRYDDALVQYDSAYRISLKPGAGSLTKFWLEGKANVYYEKGDFEKAMMNYKKSVDLIKNIRSEVLIRTLGKLADTYDTLGMYVESSHTKGKLLIAKDSLAKYSEAQKQKELLIKFQVKEYEEELAYLQLKAKSDRMAIILLSLLILSIIIIASIYLYKQKQILRIKRREIELEKRNLEVELENKNLSESKLKVELDFKNQELTGQALNLIQKTELLEQMHEDIKMIMLNAPVEMQSQLNSLARKFSASNRVSRDWENFKIYFDQVHKGFFDNLYMTYPDLNPKEIRLCALLKLNLTTKEIASIMDISPDSAKTARHRIRRKLGISEEENLGNFLNRFNPN